MSESAKPARAHETVIEIDAPVNEVWRAITEPEALARWFAPKMTVQPGKGGLVVADWGPGLEWNTRIEAWEPPMHLRLVETRDQVMSSSPDKEALAASRLVQDYTIEARGCTTVLRLVHSGFGDSEGWDQEFEGTRSGWASCFLRMKLGLEEHRGEAAENFIVTQTAAGLTPQQALDRLNQEILKESWTTVLTGYYHVCLLAAEWNRSVITVSIQRIPAGALVYLEFLLFGTTATHERDGIEQAWKARLASLFTS